MGEQVREWREDETPVSFEPRVSDAIAKLRADAARLERIRWWLLLCSALGFLATVLIVYGVGAFAVALSALFVQLLIAVIWGSR